MPPGLGFGMAYTIQYLTNGAEIAETPWSSDMPPSRDFAWQGIMLREADTAIIRDEVGKHLAVITEKTH
jgi:hypothetical protein